MGKLETGKTGEINLNVHWGTVEMFDEESRAKFILSPKSTIVLLSSENLTKKKKREWKKVAKIVLLGPNYKGPNKSKGGK